MSNTIGNTLKVTIFGQSHSDSIGAVIDGLPAGERIDEERIQAFMRRRAPGQSAESTSRSEADVPELLSGLVDGMTCGAPLAMRIKNADARSRDYDFLKTHPRPSHADYPAYVKYAAHNDIRGGGQFSGRLTAPLCYAGAVAEQLLERRGIYIGAHAYSIAGVRDKPFDPMGESPELFASIAAKPFPTIHDAAAERMRDRILRARGELDSVGGIIETMAVGVPVGLGEPMFNSFESELARLIYSIPGVRGIEFGVGFEAANMRGSEHNDQFTVNDERVITETNRCGGIQGGITNGMPILFRVAMKPTPSIASQQHTVELTTNTPSPLEIHGRHDPCIVPRAVPCMEAALAIVTLDLLLAARLW